MEAETAAVFCDCSESAMKGISKFLFLVGTCLYIYRIDIGAAKLTEYMYSLAIYAAFLYLLYEHDIAKLMYIRPSTYAWVALAFLSVIFATSLTLIRYDVSFDREGVRLLLKFVLNILLFMVLYVLFVDDKAFFRRMGHALSVPLFIYAVFPFLPISVMGKFVDTGGYGGRFMGFSVTPGAVGYPMIEAISFIYVEWLALRYYKSSWRFVWFAFLLGCIMVLIWSGCRLPLIAVVVCIFAGTFLFRAGMLKTRLSNTIIKSSLHFGVVSILCFFALRFLVPLHVQETFTTRVFGLSMSKMSLDTSLIKLALVKFTDPAVNPRLGSTVYYGDLCWRNPLGLGINCMQGFGRELNGTKVPPDSFLSTLIHGGIVLAVAMAILIGSGFRSVARHVHSARRCQRDLLMVTYLGAATALVGFLVTSLFAGFSTYDMRFWIVLAMCLAGLDTRSRGEVNQQPSC